MAAKYILLALSFVFLTAAVVRFLRDGRRLGPASRTWLIVGAMFGAVSWWLLRGATI